MGPYLGVHLSPYASPWKDTGLDQLDSADVPLHKALHLSHPLLLRLFYKGKVTFQVPGSGAWVPMGSMHPAELRCVLLPQGVPVYSKLGLSHHLCSVFLSDKLVGSSCDVHVGTSSLLSFLEGIAKG